MKKLYEMTVHNNSTISHEDLNYLNRKLFSLKLTDPLKKLAYTTLAIASYIGIAILKGKDF